MHALIAGTQGASAAINGAGAVQAIGEGDGTTAAMRSFDALFSAIGDGAAASKLRKAKAKLDSAISEAIETSQEAADVATPSSVGNKLANSVDDLVDPQLDNNLLSHLANPDHPNHATR